LVFRLRLVPRPATAPYRWQGVTTLNDDHRPVDDTRPESRAVPLTAPTALDAEQRVAEAFFRWAPQELVRRRAQADEAIARARQTNDEARWQVAERAEGRWRQLDDMVSARSSSSPYFARIQCTLGEGAANVALDLRVSNFPRSESFPGSDGTEVLDVSHLAAVADLVRNPAQRRLVIPLTEQQLLQAQAGGPLSVHDALVEDVEWDGPTITRVAPRFGAVFEDRVARRLQAGPSTSLEAMADVLDPTQSQVLSDRDPARRVLILDGPAGTGKTVVAAHRIAVVAGPDRPGLYVVPSATLAAYVRPALPRLGLDGRGTRVVTPLDLLAELAPELLPEVSFPSAPAWARDAGAVAPGVGRTANLVRVVRGWPRARRHPSALMRLAVRAGRRLAESPGWVIVDEAQAFTEDDYRALAQLAARDAWWVLAGDLLQREHPSLAWADILQALQKPKSTVHQVWLNAAYRIPPTIHAAAEEIRRQLDPSGPASESVRWHPVPGQVAQLVAAPLAALGAWLKLWRSASLSGTGAVIVPDSYPPEEMALVREALTNLGSPPHLLTPENPAYRGGLVLAPLSAVRGLEFDAVLIWDACAQTYPHTAEAGRRLYTALTRARRLALAVCPPHAVPSQWTTAWSRVSSD